MSIVHQFRFEAYSERGLDKRLTTGYFGTTAESITDDTAWIIALRNFEQTLVEKYPTAGIGLYYGMDEGKMYAVKVEDDCQVAEVLDYLMAYRDANEPDAAIMLEILHAPVPVSRLVFGRENAALDHDALYWHLARARALKLSLNGIQSLAQHSHLMDVLTAFPWLEDHSHCKLGSPDFWSRVYSGEGFARAEDSDGVVAQTAASRIDALLWDLDYLDGDNFYASPRKPNHRLLKIEVSRAVFNASLIGGVTNMLQDFQRGWAVRFAVFEELLSGNSYLGSVICDCDGALVLEGSQIVNPKP